MVGVHLLAFGRVFAARFTPIGWALVAAAVAGLVGGPDAVLLVTGLLCALVLLGAAAQTVLAAARALS